jgi:uncharacterized surface protein with fasciclin (FAS1) repeats
MKLLTTSLIAGALMTAPASAADSCGGASSHAYTATEKAPSIVDTAVENGNFQTLAAALGAAGLVETLQGDGPFTVFAPSDAAFAALPAGTVDELLKPENRDRLTAILTYHVVPGKISATEVIERGGAVSVNGQRIDFQVDVRGDETIVRADAARVVTADIMCSNGIIHVIDSVILPAEKNIVATASEAGTFETLLAAAKAAGLAETLSDGGPFTVFAPTDDAFAALPAGTVENLLKPENKDQLVRILKHHVVSGRIYSEQVIAQGRVTTLAGTTLELEANEGGASIGGGGLAALDIDTSNGVIHVVDAVLLP